MMATSNNILRNLPAVLAAGLALALSTGNAAATPPPALRVTATIFPLADWTREIARDRLPDGAITLLESNGTDMHSFQPSVRDMGTIGGSDLFLYVGGSSDEWGPGVLAATTRSAPNRRALSMLDALDGRALPEELAEGMEHGHDEDDGELDEHVWLSLRNAIVLMSRIADELSALDPDGAPTYRANAAAYADRLRDLDRRYAELRSSARRDVLLFADRFPFRYLTEDYDLRFYAAFPGCSAESEASFATIAFLAQKVREEALPVILTTERPGHRLAQTVAAAAGRPGVAIRALDSMQSVTSADLAAGTTYLAIMERNLEVLREALEQ
jgi:zinc transport system substrate-binding protein